MPRCSGAAASLGTRSCTKRVAASNCSIGSSLALIIASSDVPVSNWLEVSSPKGW